MSATWRPCFIGTVCFQLATFFFSLVLHKHRLSCAEIPFCCLQQTDEVMQQWRQTLRNWRKQQHVQSTVSPKSHHVLVFGKCPNRQPASVRGSSLSEHTELAVRQIRFLPSQRTNPRRCAVSHAASLKHVQRQVPAKCWHWWRNSFTLSRL
jgi:hypothetical protein